MSDRLNTHEGGYFTAMEDVMCFINTLDEVDIKTLRSKIYHFCLEARPKVSRKGDCE